MNSLNQGAGRVFQNWARATKNLTTAMISSEISFAGSGQQGLENEWQHVKILPWTAVA
ncbi:MAG TPA: hypothetical protein VNN22_18190 [Verrucomicrobiae bacterium]|nr:hypothetical protein [Verrucomicrobiae bacterium]